MGGQFGVRRVADRVRPLNSQVGRMAKSPGTLPKLGLLLPELHNMIYLIHERVESSGQVCKGWYGNRGTLQ